MTHGSLFSGIGGFDLAARWMGWDNVFHVEKDKYARRILEHHFPETDSHEDIKEFDTSDYVGRIGLISGGFPCQPYSAAGERRGTADDRHLWPEMFRVVREISPRWVVAENVYGLLNWESGVQFDACCADLEGAGYEVLPSVLPACGVNAPHKRDRVWIIARRIDTDTVRDRAGDAVRGDGSGTTEVGGRLAEPKPRQASVDGDAPNTGRVGRQRGRGTEDPCERPGQRVGIQPDVEGQSQGGDPADTDSAMLEGRDGQREGSWATVEGVGTEPHDQSGRWETFPTQPPVCGGDDGLSGRLDGITFPRWRTEALKCLGNAIVPQVALTIFQAIERYDSQH